MANQAAKKASKIASQKGSQYGTVILFANLIYCIWVIYIWSKDTSRWQELKAWSWTKKIGIPGLTFGFYSLAYNGLIDSAINKQSASSYLDLLGLTIAAQLGSILTNWSWVLYAVVPVSLIVKYILPLFGMLSASAASAQQPEDIDPAEAKRLAKKERKASRSRVIR